MADEKEQKKVDLRALGDFLQESDKRYLIGGVRVVSMTDNLTGQKCPVSLMNGEQCSVIYDNDTGRELTVGLADQEGTLRYKMPDGPLHDVVVPAGGYAEVSYFRKDGKVYVVGG